MTRRKAVIYSLILSIVLAVVISFLPGVDGLRTITVGNETFTAELYEAWGVPFLFGGKYGDFGVYENPINLVFNIAFWVAVLFFPAYIIFKPVKKKITNSAPPISSKG